MITFPVKKWRNHVCHFYNFVVYHLIVQIVCLNDVYVLDY